MVHHRPLPSRNIPLLVSHALCPYVQRAAIVLHEKSVAFERRDVDLARRPAWFTALSPLGKTPVLVAGDEAVFESAVICEYLDDVHPPRLHPEDALARARERAWMEFGSSVLNGIGAFYGAATEDALQARAQELHARFQQVEAALAMRASEGPWFAGPRFGMVDAVFGPVFRYFDVFDALGDFGVLDGLPRVQAWRRALAARPSVVAAVAPDYPVLLSAFLKARGSALSHRIDADESALS